MSVGGRGDGDIVLLSSNRCRRVTGCAANKKSSHNKGEHSSNGANAPDTHKTAANIRGFVAKASDNVTSFRADVSSASHAFSIVFPIACKFMSRACRAPDCVVGQQGLPEYHHFSTTLAGLIHRPQPPQLLRPDHRGSQRSTTRASTANSSAPTAHPIPRRL